MLEESQLNESFLANLGSAIAPLFAPLGWGDWQASVAAITGLAQRKMSWLPLVSCTALPKWQRMD